jgi:hypothetical protein
MTEEAYSVVPRSRTFRLELRWVNAQVNTMRDVFGDNSEEVKEGLEDRCKGELPEEWIWGAYGQLN